MHLGTSFRSQFPLFDQHPDTTYLDNASTVHKPRQVIDAMQSYMTTSYANIHRGAYALAEQSEQIYHRSKQSVARLIGGDHREIAYTYNATHACNILAQSLTISYKLGAGDVVLVGLWDHHATIVPRQLLAQHFGFEVKFIPLDRETLDIDWTGLALLLTDYRIKIVMCSQVSNVTGIVYDMKRLGDLLSEDVFFAIDGSQAVPHLRVDVKQLGCDAYIFTGHKMMGPTGIGVLWIEKMKGRSLQTLSGGGGIIESVTTQGCSLIRTIDKFEPGTPNLIGAVGLGVACDLYEEYDLYASLPEYERGLITHLESLLADQQGIEIVGSSSSIHKGVILALAVDHPLEFAEHLADADICVRAGGHCAHPLLHFFGYDRGLVRLSVFGYNTMEEMERVAELVQSISL